VGRILVSVEDFLLLTKDLLQTDCFNEKKLVAFDEWTERKLHISLNKW